MKLALVTASYAPDFSRCENLHRSAQRFLCADIDHYLVVPRRDVPLFKRLCDGRTRIIEVEAILPSWVRRVPFIRKWWVTPFTMPVRGWIMQQIVKLAVPVALEEDVCIFADSDVTLVRPLSAAEFVKEGRVRLHRIPGEGRGPKHLQWNRVAAELLGLPARDYFGADYIGQLVCWRRENVVKLHTRLEEVSGREWRRLLAGTLHFAEYILYGVFAEYVLGDESGHYFDSRDLCHCSWHHKIHTPAQLEEFVRKIEPHHVAILVQSYLDFGPQVLDPIMQAVVSSG